MTMNGQTKKRQFPNAMLIVAGIMVFCLILTWVVPAGMYDTVEGSTTLAPNSFHYIEKSPVSLWQFFSAVFGGMSKSANIIAFTFMVGGLFNVLIDSKAVDGFVIYLIRRLGSKVNLIIPVLGLIMSLLGATGVMANPVVAVLPIGLILARRLKLDAIVAMGVMYLAAYGGYATSPICAMTVQVAQKIAGLPMLSGFGMRCVIWLLFFLPTIGYLMHYVNTIVKDPSKSLMADVKNTEPADDVEYPFTWREAIALLSLVVSLGVYTYGSLKLGWGMGEMATVILMGMIVSAIAAGMGANGFVNAFLEGAKKMTFSAMLIGLASGVSVILSQGNILHTIIYATGVLINSLPHFLAAPIMYWFNLLFNFFVTSGSGQATIIMPIMAPLADVVGVTRQTAVTAFQLGDGLSNIIFPTSGTMMACLAVAGVDYRKWVKWIMPLFLFWVLLGTIVIIVLSAIGIA